MYEFQIGKGRGKILPTAKASMNAIPVVSRIRKGIVHKVNNVAKNYSSIRIVIVVVSS